MPTNQPDSRYRNKKTGTIYASVIFNDTSIAEVTTEAGAVFAVRADNLEKVEPDNQAGDELPKYLELITNCQFDKDGDLIDWNYESGRLRQQLEALTDKYKKHAYDGEVEQTVDVILELLAAQKQRWAEELKAKLPEKRMYYSGNPDLGGEVLADDLHENSGWNKAINEVTAALDGLIDKEITE
jgi:sulfatase maturation enzyme AslB (radical SAM superfamily)